MWTLGAKAIACVVMILAATSSAHAAPLDSQMRLDDIIIQLPPPIVFEPYLLGGG